MASGKKPTPAATTTSFLSSMQRYAAGALLAIAVHQAQVQQTYPLGSTPHDDDGRERTSNSSCASTSGSSSSADSVADDPDLWVHHHSGLLRPVFRFLEIDPAAWPGLEETAGSSPAKNHVGDFMRLLAVSEEWGEEDCSDQEMALAKGVDVMDETMGVNPGSSMSKKEKHLEYENECREKLSGGEVEQQQSPEEEEDAQAALLGSLQVPDDNLCDVNEVVPVGVVQVVDEKPLEEERMLSYPRKVTVLFELLSACLADRRDGDNKCTRRRNGYDARHRVTLRLLATWLDVRWTKMEAIEMMVAFSAIAVSKEEQAKEEESKSSKSKWAKWKRGGLAAPAIAAGFGALAPTLGTIIPVIGASGFAAAASAAGTVTGSVAVAASFGAAGAGLAGTKMARRTGSVDEFEFKAIEENQNQGRLAVEILVSGFVFDESDFVRPWEGISDNMERYALLWESKNLISVSTAIQDWLTSRIAMEFMKQGAMMTVLSTLMVALAWPATLLAATDFIDSKWSIAIDRSDKAGKLLAEVLLKGLQGNRPVTLVGYSLGARVIFKCLQCLAETEKNAEMVERVVLLGAPISIKDESWESARKMVAGRFINAYSTTDWTIGVAFRASLLSQGLAGIQPIKVPGIENVDVTDLVEGHSSYLWATQQILEQLELDAYYPVFRNAHQSQ